jgi:putative glutamine amidotransferase
MKIGLTYTGTPEKHENYARWLRAKGEHGLVRGGQLPVKDSKRVQEGQLTEQESRSIQEGHLPDEDIEVIMLSVEDDNLSMIDDCDALVLSGGVDIHPSFYGGSENYSAGLSEGPVNWQSARDEFEIKALERAWAKKKPVLGVCRGLQLINVVRGGTLVQDMGAEKDERHQYHRLSDMQHDVTVLKDSLLESITGGSGHVNSAHHQAIDRLGEGLRVNCHSDDGVIEGIEWSEPGDKPFMLAVQWHPERMYIHQFQDRELYMNIRNRFIEEIKKSKEQ